MIVLAILYVVGMLVFFLDRGEVVFHRPLAMVSFFVAVASGLVLAVQAL